MSICVVCVSVSNWTSAKIECHCSRMKIAHMLSANIFHAPRFRASNERIEKCALTKEGVLVSSPHTNTRRHVTERNPSHNLAH